MMEVHRSAIVVLVPEADPLVAAYRERYDPSAAQGMPAHITLLYPFLAPASLREEVLSTLRALFASFPAFPYALTAVRAFPDLVYLAPEPASPFRALIAALAARFPETPPYEGSIPVAEVVPHLTVAHVSDPDELEELRACFSARAAPKLPLRLRASEVLLMDDRSRRWSPRQAFRLGGDAAHPR
jgi:2'-5' RNA ligase